MRILIIYYDKAHSNYSFLRHTVTLTLYKADASRLAMTEYVFPEDWYSFLHFRSVCMHYRNIFSQFLLQIATICSSKILISDHTYSDQFVLVNKCFFLSGSMYQLPIPRYSILELKVSVVAILLIVRLFKDLNHNV